MHSVKMQFLIYKLIHKDFAVLPKCRSCPCFSAALFRSRRHKLCIAHFRAKHEKYAHTVDPDGPGKIISHSAGHSVVNNNVPLIGRQQKCLFFNPLFQKFTYPLQMPLTNYAISKGKSSPLFRFLLLTF